VHGAGRNLDSSARVQGSLRSALTGRPWTRSRSAVTPGSVLFLAPPCIFEFTARRTSVNEECTLDDRSLHFGLTWRYSDVAERLSEPQQSEQISVCDGAAVPLLQRCATASPH